MKLAFRVEGLSYLERCVLAAIATHADDRGHAWPGEDLLAAETSLAVVSGGPPATAGPSLMDATRPTRASAAFSRRAPARNTAVTPTAFPSTSATSRTLETPCPH